MNEITLVTAFFDIGRKDFKAIPRSNDTYIEYFKFWARIQNTLIVYTEERYKEQIFHIRNEFGLADRTIIITINDLYAIEPKIYKNMKLISESEWFISFRLMPRATSNNPEYSYLVFLKTWFLADAVKRKLISNQVAWIDFGYNHGGTLYTEPKDFEFTWEYPFSDKIHIFYYKKIDTKPIFETVRRLNDCIMGGLIILPRHLAGELWKLNRRSMIILNKVGFSDDDQLLLLMSYRERPQIFELHKSDWFLPLKEYGGEHLSTRHYNKNRRLTFLRDLYINLLNQLKKRRLIRAYLKRNYKNLMYKDD